MTDDQTLELIGRNEDLGNGSRNIDPEPSSAVKVIELLRAQLDAKCRELSDVKKELKRLQSAELVKKPSAVKPQQPLNNSRCYMEDISRPELRSTHLIQRYKDLYYDHYPEVWESLAAESDPIDFRLREKLLYSVVVLGFRYCKEMRERIRLQIGSATQLKQLNQHVDNTPVRQSCVDVAQVISSHLHRSSPVFDVSTITQDVFNRVTSTLFDYPSLSQNKVLLRFTDEIVRLAWSLVNFHPMPFRIEPQPAKFHPLHHQRFHDSDASSERVLTVIWPALFQSPADGAGDAAAGGGESSLASTALDATAASCVAYGVCRT